MTRILTGALAAVIITCHAATAQDMAQDIPEARDSARVFVFGNSLIHHLTDTDETTVPHWLAVMARHEGRDLALDGRWGFPRQFAAELPPPAEWTLAQVTPAWNQARPFADGNFDTVILNPENYIQYHRADIPYPGDNPGRESPMGATVAVLDWVAANSDGPRVLIYEGWADLHPFVKDFPPRDRDMQRYYRHAQRGYAAWYDDYVARLSAVRRDMDITLLPVGRVMAELLSQPPLSDIPVTALYSDPSPHGTETIYLLAAMISYAAIYGARPPQGVPLPDTIDPAFAAAYEGTADRIWDIMQAETR